MANGKLCIDIGGTKIIFAIIDKPDHIVKSKRIDTPPSKDLFLEVLGKNVREYLNFSNETINVSIAGRLDSNGKVVFCPNLPILGVNFIRFMRRFSKKVSVENDGNCFGISQLYGGYLKNHLSGLAVVWGTGIGSSIIYKNKIYKGAGLATESGHIIYNYNTGKDVEDIIGGRSIKKLYGLDGFELHNLAENGDKKALDHFKDIGITFGYYLSSMVFILDPEIIVIGGSFANSWKFMKKYVYSVLKDKSLRRKITIKIAKGKFYVIRGCYFLDEYEDTDY